jgi:hypothetical protein
MATTKTSGKKAKARPAKAKKAVFEGGDPIIIGGGGGLNKRGTLLGGTTISFSHGWYKNHNPKKPHQHDHPGDTLGGLAISSGGGKTTPQINPLSNIEILCRRPPGTVAESVASIGGENMTIDFSGDFVKQPGGEYYCSYLVIAEVQLDGDPIFTSDNGNCTVTANNTLPERPKPKPRRKS